MPGPFMWIRLFLGTEFSSFSHHTLLLMRVVHQRVTEPTECILVTVS